MRAPGGDAMKVSQPFRLAATCTNALPIGRTTMIYPLAYALMLVGLLLAGWTGVSTARRLPAHRGQILCCLALEGALTAQSVIAVARIIGGAHVTEPATFIAYALGVLAPLALGAYIAQIERTRWGSLALCFTAVVVAVMALRLLQLWRMGVTVV